METEEVGRTFEGPWKLRKYICHCSSKYFEVEEPSASSVNKLWNVKISGTPRG